MPELCGYHHLSLTVTDLARSTAWWTEVLDFEVFTRFERDGMTKVVMRHPACGAYLSLTGHGERAPSEVFSEFRTGMDHLAFSVSSPAELEAWKARFEARHVEHSEIKASVVGDLVAFRDPDNIAFEVYADSHRRAAGADRDSNGPRKIHGSEGTLSNEPPVRAPVVGPAEGSSVDLGGMGVVFKIWGEATDGALAIVEHPMDARRLVPPHVHEAEDELSYVLEGTFGVRVGEFEAEAGPGSYIYKPKGIPHTFWNPTDAPARMIELIFPAGFERFFEALGPIMAHPGDPADLQRQREELGRRYCLGFDPGWVEDLKGRHGLKLLGEP